MRPEFESDVNYLQAFITLTFEMVHLTEKVPHIFSSGKVSYINKTIKKCEIQQERLSHIFDQKALSERR